MSKKNSQINSIPLFTHSSLTIHLPASFPLINTIHRLFHQRNLQIFGIIKQITPNDSFNKSNVKITIDKIKISYALNVIRQRIEEIQQYQNRLCKRFGFWQLFSQSNLHMLKIRTLQKISQNFQLISSYRNRKHKMQFFKILINLNKKDRGYLISFQDYMSFGQKIGEILSRVKDRIQNSDKVQNNQQVRTFVYIKVINIKQKFLRKIIIVPIKEFFYKIKYQKLIDNKNRCMNKLWKILNQQLHQTKIKQYKQAFNSILQIGIKQKIYIYQKRIKSLAKIIHHLLLRSFKRSFSYIVQWNKYFIIKKKYLNLAINSIFGKIKKQAFQMIFCQSQKNKKSMQIFKMLQFIKLGNMFKIFQYNYKQNRIKNCKQFLNFLIDLMKNQQLSNITKLQQFSSDSNMAFQNNIPCTYYNLGKMKSLTNKNQLIRIKIQEKNDQSLYNSSNQTNKNNFIKKVYDQQDNKKIYLSSTPKINRGFQQLQDLKNNYQTNSYKNKSKYNISQQQSSFHHHTEKDLNYTINNNSYQKKSFNTKPKLIPYSIKTNQSIKEINNPIPMKNILYQAHNQKYMTKLNKKQFICKNQMLNNKIKYYESIFLSKNCEPQPRFY